jgi:hypothetical protein
VDNLDCQHDEEIIENILRNSGYAITFQSFVATVENLTTSQFLEFPPPEIIHFTGHGDPGGAVVVENMKGEGVYLNSHDLKTILKISKTGRTTQFVFVAACYSEQTGNVFVDAGIPHVVAVKQLTKVSNSSARLFTDTFYRLLIISKLSVKEAFEGAATRVRLESNGIKSNEFILLPENGNHDVYLFQNITVGELENTSPHLLCRTFINARKSNVFIQRNFALHQIYSHFADRVSKRISRNFVVLRGETGVGKTTLVLKALDHMMRRSIFDLMVYVPLDKHINGRIHEPLCSQQIFHAILESINDLHTVSRDTRLSSIDEFCTCIKSRKSLEKIGINLKRVNSVDDSDFQPNILFVFDGIDKFISSNGKNLSMDKDANFDFERSEDMPSKLITFMEDVLSKCSCVNFLVTVRSQTELFPTNGKYLKQELEKEIILEPLCPEETAELLIQACRRRIDESEKFASAGDSFVLSSPTVLTPDQFIPINRKAISALVSAPCIQKLRGNPRAILYFAQDYANNNKLENSTICIEAAERAYSQACSGDFGTYSFINVQKSRVQEAVAISSPIPDIELVCGTADMTLSNHDYIDINTPIATATSLNSLNVESTLTTNMDTLHMELTQSNEGLRQSLIGSDHFQRANITSSRGTGFTSDISILDDENLGTDLAKEYTAKFLDGLDERHTDIWIRLSTNNRPPYLPYTHIPWSVLAKELSLVVRYITHEELKEEERSLTASDLSYLRNKIIHDSLASDDFIKQDNDEYLISIKCYKNFLLWWLPVVKTIETIKREFLCSTPILVHGFLTKDQTDRMLKSTVKPGTFLFRFSESKPGYLVMSMLRENSHGGLDIWTKLVVVDSNTGQVSMENAAEKFPSISDLISSPKYPALKRIYPGIMKADALKNLSN